MTSTGDALLSPEAKAFYQRALKTLEERGVPYLVGGAYAFARYTGIERHTKDFDVFIRRADYGRAANALEDAGYTTELLFPHWLGKAYNQEGEDFVDLIFSAGNGVAEVDDLWFEHAVPDRVIDMDVGLIPPEEMIWSKGLIMERERFDGADVAHVIRALGPKLDWERLIKRFGPHWRALYAHAILFGYIYPSEKGKIPQHVMEMFSARLQAELSNGDSHDRVCFGTVISRQQYLVDINQWGYADARLQPRGNMTAEEIAHWTAGIEVDGA
ncbi:MAG TPA: nucleotidyltransferase family protein [Thermoanaerobaculia bacterium]|nr:nucleotidyltransferase family protein [Thermoanaerobaculia bacterium]